MSKKTKAKKKSVTSTDSATAKPAKTAAAKPAKTAAAKPAKTAAAKPAKTNGKVRRDFVSEILPFIKKEFEKLEDRNAPPRGWGKAMYQKIADKFGCTINTGDQYFWKAKWEYPKELGIKATR